MTKKARFDPGLVRSQRIAGRLPATAATAVAIVAIAAIAAEASATRTAAAGARLVLGFVNAQRMAIHRITVQTLDRTGRVSVAHLDKSKSSWPTGLTIRRQGHGVDIPMLAKRVRAPRPHWL
jgi:hypothetical protein